MQSSKRFSKCGQICRENQFFCTIGNWYRFLIFAQGEPGRPGQRGIPGVRGLPGNIGLAGIDGKDGERVRMMSYLYGFVLVTLSNRFDLNII